MATTTMHAPETHHIHPIRIVIAAIIGIVMLTIAFILYRHNHEVPAPPTNSTQDTQPNSSQNTPPGGSVDESTNPNNATTPSPNGTNGNPMSSQ